MQQFCDFFNQPFFWVVGGILSLIAIFKYLAPICRILNGIFRISPVLYKLGISLSKRKIAIFANDKFDDIKNILVDSGLFEEKNIKKIDVSSIKKGEDISFYIIHYKFCKNEIDEILKMKKDSYAMIVYAPQDEGRIDEDMLKKINYERNSVVVNFRGRLLNDVLISMVTTSFRR